MSKQNVFNIAGADSRTKTKWRKPFSPPPPPFPLSLIFLFPLKQNKLLLTLQILFLSICSVWPPPAIQECWQDSPPLLGQRVHGVTPPPWVTQQSFGKSVMGCDRQHTRALRQPLNIPGSCFPCSLGTTTTVTS